MPQRIAEICSVVLLTAGLIVMQALIGGTRLVFGFPSYGLIALAGIVGVFASQKRTPRADQVCLWTSAIFFSYIVLRALTSPAPYVARYDLYSVLGGLIVYGLVATVTTRASTRLMVLAVLLFCGMAHVVVGGLQFRDGNNFMLIPFLQRVDYGRRASGFYVCPNHLAGLLEVLGIFGLSMVCWSRWAVWAKLLIGYAAGVCYVGLVLTGSRGGYLSTTASLLLFFLLSLYVLAKAGRSLAWRIGGAGAVAAVVIAAVVTLFVQKSDFLTGRAQTVFEKTNMRVDLWQAALEQWKLSPIIGTGSQTYIYYGRKFRTDRVQADPIHVHNDYLQLLCDYGVLGVAGFLIFLVAHSYNGWRSFQQLGPRRVAGSRRLLSNGLALNMGALCALVAYVVHSAFDFNLHIPANVLLLAFVFGVLANGGVPRETTETRFAWPSAWPRAAIFALSIVGIIQCVRLLPAEYFAERARVSLRDERPDEAAAFALRGIERERQNPNLFFYLGRARVTQGSMLEDPNKRVSLGEAGLDAFLSARSLAPLDIGPVLDLALTFDALGRFSEAEWMYGVALGLDPKAVAVREYYQAHLDRWADYDETFEPFADMNDPGEEE